MALVIDDAPVSLCSKLVRVGSIVWESFALAGLTLNMGAAETVAAFRWAGDGASAAKRDLQLRLRSK